MLIRPARLLIVLLAAFASACSTIDFKAEKSVSHSLTVEDTQNTFLAREIASFEEQFGSHPADQSGFHLVSDAIDALAIRLLLAERAERTIDAQYYMVANDIIGQAFIYSLVRAADRGVRVRLLIDDIGTGGMDAGLNAINNHPNIELRLFNPFASRGIRAFDLWDFKRLNRRMHNKSFTIDNQMTIIGGRNIATEYFAANAAYNFGDLDTLAIGPVVAETSAMFDDYWNHRNAIPVEQLAGAVPDDGSHLAVLRSKLKENSDSLLHTPYADAVKASYNEFIRNRGDDFFWGRYELVYDSPDKSIRAKAGEAEKIVTALQRSVATAEESLLVISPYFVPRKAGIKGLIRLQNTGVQIDVVTNSLASSDHLLVHGGYTPARKPLLKAGVRLFEVREDFGAAHTETARTRKASSSLHTKAFVVDKRYFFMGSFNWDPRSANLNTELGVIVDSTPLATGVAEAMYAAAPIKAYEVFLNDKGQLRWRTQDDFGNKEIFDKEPNTGFWLRLGASLSRWLPISSQL